MASAAAYRASFIASLDGSDKHLDPVAERSNALIVAEMARRAANDDSGSAAAKSRVEHTSAYFQRFIERHYDNNPPECTPQQKKFTPRGPTPHRLTLLPLDASAFENASPDDAKWLAEQEARFASDSEGLATKPNFGLISFEAINFMDGHRSTAEIADLVSAEYLIDIDQAWVDRLVNILEKQKLVANSMQQIEISRQHSAFSP